MTMNKEEFLKAKKLMDESPQISAEEWWEKLLEARRNLDFNNRPVCIKCGADNAYFRNFTTPRPRPPRSWIWSDPQCDSCFDKKN